MSAERVDESEGEDDSAESFSRAVEEQAPHSFRTLLTHTRADALVAITEHFLATSGQAGRFRGLKGSERCQVVLRVDISTLREQADPPSCAHEHCHLDEKPWISPTTARRLACDASLVTVLEDENGQVLNIGRRSRTVPAHINRALKERDKTCRFPGCCESRHVDAHHIRHWADGGETRLDNLVTLCRYHHRQLHSGSYSISVGREDGQSIFRFITPAGAHVEASFYPQFPEVCAESFSTALQALAPAVDFETAITKWRGESCDYGMAIDALISRDAGERFRGIVGGPAPGFAREPG